ncbi:MAG: Glu-tRNA(Gln) amidotransferase subunit GatE [Methermicoccaceae archaeon]
MKLISDISQLDYEALGLMAGLEIHQQLDTAHKLFCRSPTTVRDTGESSYEFVRYLRPARSEMGEVDAAALSEVAHIKKHIYKAYDSTCLVEDDEEPPSTLNEEALDIALLVARMLNSHTVEQVHTMRKTVIDGSNTSGFQRTALVATGGYVPSSLGKVGMGVLCLEEEACQKVEDRGDTVVWSLDRLGIPLVELGTDPDIKSPAHAREVAAYIGMLLRSTGKVKRGIGSIRQDVNVSIREGARTELKGVQELGLLDQLVAYEAMRQANLIIIRNELVERGAHVDVDGEVVELTQLFEHTESKVLKHAIARGGVVYGCVLRRFGGLVGAELQPRRRLGSELSDYAKKAGVGGIFHTDELPAYGITQQEVDAVRQECGAEEEDCVVLVAHEKSRALAAMREVQKRARKCLEGVPNETRRALQEGSSAFMRPLPGSARMYPETDVPPVIVDEKRLSRIVIPELLDAKSERFSSDYALSKDAARQLVHSGLSDLFERLVQSGASPSNVARTLTSTLAELKSEGVATERLTEQKLSEALLLYAKGTLAKEGIPDVLRCMAEDEHLSAEEAVERAGLTGMGKEEVRALIEQVVSERQQLVHEKGMGAVGPLMGVVMGQLRGKMDGRLVSSILSQTIQELLSREDEQ